MGCINTDYASYLHQLSFNPYSQHCVREDGSLAWKIRTLTNEAAYYIIEPLRAASGCELRAGKANFEVVKTSLETTSLSTLLNTMNEPCDPKVQVRFVTPTAFKSQGAYVIMPTVRLMLQNLLMHFGQVYNDDKESLSGMAEDVDQRVKVLSYNLRSNYFEHVASGKKRVPAFVGSMTLGLRDAGDAGPLVSTLLKFGEYAGMGVKTSMGMGGFTCC